MKKLKEELFIKAEEIYGKEKIALLRNKIYDIGMCIMFDAYLRDKEWDYLEAEKKKSLI